MTAPAHTFKPGELVGISGFEGFRPVYEKDRLIKPADVPGYWRVELAGVLIPESWLKPWSSDLPTWTGAVDGVRPRGALCERQCKRCSSCRLKAKADRMRGATA